MQSEPKSPVSAKPDRSHDDATVESFARDPVYAAEYLKAAIEDGDEAELRVARERVARAFGGQPAPRPRQD